MFLGAQNGFHFGPKGANNLDLQSQSTRYPRWAGYEVVRASMMMNSVMIMLMVVVVVVVMMRTMTYNPDPQDIPSERGTKQ